MIIPMTIPGPMKMETGTASSSLGPGDFAHEGFYGDPFGFYDARVGSAWKRHGGHKGKAKGKAKGKGRGKEMERVPVQEAEAEPEAEQRTQPEPEPELETESEVDGQTKGKEKEREKETENEIFVDAEEQPQRSIGIEEAHSRAARLLEELIADQDTDEDDDWLLFPPPDALRKAPHISSEIIQEVVRLSLENLGVRAAEAQQRVREEEERRRREEEEEARTAEGRRKISTDGEPYLPVILVQPEAEQDAEQEAESDAETIKEDAESARARSSSDVMGRGLVLFPVKQQKKHRYNLSKLFQRLGSDRGESSAAGATKNALRSIYHHRSVSGSNLEDPKEEKRPSSIVKAIVQAKLAEAREVVEQLEQEREKGKEKEKAKPVEEVECVSCLDEFHPKDVIKAPCHSYCTDCFTRLISTALQNEQQWPPKCCLNDIPTYTIFRYVTSDLKDTYNARAEEWNVPVGDRIYCSEATCSLFLKPGSVNAATRSARCASGHWTCAICRGAGHFGQDCPEDRELVRTNELAEEEGWKHCFSCGALVEHREACQHMTCRCGAQFCYVCTRRWKTCSCTMEQLAALKREVAERREARLEREAREEEELQEALRQIEEFEREEALKAELLRQETKRLEDERRQRELEERVQIESLRRQNVERKYAELRVTLGELQELQEVLYEYEVDEAARELSAEKTTSLSGLAKKQEAERADIEVTARNRITAIEMDLNTEYAARLENEQAIEKNYLSELETCWAKRKDGAAKIEEAITALRAKHDRYHSEWQAWRSEEIDKIGFAAGEEKSIQVELLDNQRRRTEEGFAKREKDLKVRNRTGKRWLIAVFAERERLLAHMENEELDGDADAFSDLDIEEERSTTVSEPRTSVDGEMDIGVAQ